MCDFCCQFIKRKWQGKEVKRDFNREKEVLQKAVYNKKEKQKIGVEILEIL